jgi:2-oxoglutarate ferredoxin oxidoreductase subunit alpha
MNSASQMRQLLTVEAEVPMQKLIPTLNYDGTPMTAEFVRQAVLKHLQPAKAQAAE